MRGYLIYHRRRVVKQFGKDKVYCDPTSRSGNQDPYVWNTRFLHTYCINSYRSSIYYAGYCGVKLVLANGATDCISVQS
jgi:hypothetical protein